MSKTTIAACALLLASVSAAASQTVTTSCYRVAHGRTCTTHFIGPVDASPRVISVPVDPEAEAKWRAFCDPKIVTGSDGVGRYVYSKPGCENGRSE